MKIEIRDGAHHMTIPIPGWLVLNKLGKHLVLKYCGRHLSVTADFPPEKAERLFDALERTRQKYGSWELVHILSADGEEVIITV